MPLNEQMTEERKLLVSKVVVVAQLTEDTIANIIITLESFRCRVFDAWGCGKSYLGAAITQKSPIQKSKMFETNELLKRKSNTKNESTLLDENCSDEIIDP